MNVLLFMLLKFLLKVRKVGLVLVGHGYAPGVTDPFIESQHQDLKQLKRAIRLCRGLGLRFISMEELLRLSKQGFPNSFSWVHLTFDDGYQNNYTRLYPFLKEISLPFTLFVTTGAIEANEWQFVDQLYCAFLHTGKKSYPVRSSRQQPIPEDRQNRFRMADEVMGTLRRSDKRQAETLLAGADALLTKDEWLAYRELYCENQLMDPMQLAQLASDPLVYIGSHGHHHFSLNSNFQEDDIRQEMQISQTWLCDRLKIGTQAFAYPYGQETDFTSVSRQICQQAGYAVAFTTLNGMVEPASDALLLPRLGIPSDARDFYIRLLKYLLPETLVRWILWLKRAARK